MFDKVRDFYVGDFDLLLSDKHSPVVLECAFTLDHTSHAQTTNINNAENRIHWQDDKSNEFRRNLDRNKLNSILQWSEEILDNGHEVTQGDIDHVLEDYQKLILGCAESTFNKEKT